jgi:hypothetical protein
LAQVARENKVVVVASVFERCGFGLRAPRARPLPQHRRHP